MSQPKVAAKEPVAVELEAGKPYAWCACGESSNQPFCDGSHKGSEFKPQVFKVEKSKTYYMCQCKQTGNPGFCDGAHNKI